MDFTGAAAAEGAGYIVQTGLDALGQIGPPQFLGLVQGEVDAAEARDGG